jgi:hypothetical protein
MLELVEIFLVGQMLEVVELVPHLVEVAEAYIKHQLDGQEMLVLVEIPEEYLVVHLVV